MSLAGSPSDALLRVLTYNVRRFKGREGESTVAAIGDALAALAPAVVALNEVDLQQQPQALETVAARLGGFTVAFFGHVRGRYGNALLSRLPVLAVRETHLRGGSEVVFPAGTRRLNGEVAAEGERHRIARGMLECDVELPGQQVVTVAVTHLDHISEEQRVVQVQHVVETLQASSYPSILLGDLNALTRSDYKDEEWSTLGRRAAENNWTLPAPAECLECLTTAGLVDVFVASRGGGPLREEEQKKGPLREKEEEGVRSEDNAIFSAHVGHPLYRIDYCFAALGGTSPLLEAAGARVHRDVHASDHFPVSFDLKVSLPGVNPGVTAHGGGAAVGLGSDAKL